jgi:hypothetical protein
MPTVSWKMLGVSLAVIVAAYAAVMTFEWYETFTWVDIPLHFAGGAWVGALFFALFGNVFGGAVATHTCERTKVLVLAVSLAALVGVGWEIFEYCVSTWTGIYMQPSIADTMGDFVMDIGGALTIGFWFLYIRRPRTSEMPER